MKNLLLPLALFTLSAMTYAQVGINTTDPKSTLEIKGKPDVITSPDGVIAPNITRAELIAKTSYTADQKGAIVYVTDLSGTTNTSTSKVKSIGYYYFDGAVWYSMNANVSQFSFGDIKTGIQPSDHNGWIRLDGRSTTDPSLSNTQQAQAINFFGATLPNATNAFLVQNGNLLGEVTGSNNKNIILENLPNVNLTADGNSAGTPSGIVNISNTTTTMQDAGNHSHSIQFKFNVGSLGTTYNEPIAGHTNSTGSSTWTNKDTSSNGSHNHTMNPHNHTATFTGTALNNHTHTVPLGGSGTPLDITPRSLSVNAFIYLGE